jgi:DNA-binding response OmpR family regulator
VPVVLLIEDDARIRDALGRVLGDHGYAVRSATTGYAGLQEVNDDPPDVVVLDLGLRDVDGGEILRMIRSVSAVPIIVASARDEEAGMVSLLKAGADDYVVKPFSAPEVVARVRAQLRRAQGFDDTPAAALYTGPVELDPGSRRCRVDGREVDLSRREFDLLATLMRSPNRVYRRDELLELVWGSEYLSPKTVDVHVAGLRRKLGTAVKITALRGVGYRLEL